MASNVTVEEIYHAQIKSAIQAVQGILFQEMGLLEVALKKDIDCQKLKRTIEKLEAYISLFKMQFDSLRQLNERLSRKSSNDLEPLSDKHKEKYKSDSSLPDLEKVLKLFGKDTEKLKDINNYIKGLQEQNKELAEALNKAKMRYAQLSDDDVSFKELRGE